MKSNTISTALGLKTKKIHGISKFSPFNAHNFCYLLYVQVCLQMTICLEVARLQKNYVCNRRSGPPSHSDDVEKARHFSQEDLKIFPELEAIWPVERRRELVSACKSRESTCQSRHYSRALLSV